jgi:hypothetical protein
VTPLAVAVDVRVAVSSHHFAMRNILRREENFFRQGALQASASLQSHNSIKTLRPRTEYEACRSNAQSTIIF